MQVVLRTHEYDLAGLRRREPQVLHGNLLNARKLAQGNELQAQFFLTLQSTRAFSSKFTFDIAQVDKPHLWPQVQQ